MINIIYNNKKQVNSVYTLSFIFIIFSFIFLLSACDRTYNNHSAIVLREQREKFKVKEETQEEKQNKALLRSNQIANEKELQQMKGYIERRKWEMNLLKEGLFFQEIEKGRGKIINDTSIIRMNYTIELLNGNKVFSSEIDGEKTFRLEDERDVIGLIYALRGVSNGSVIRLVIPSFLAYGIRGDGQRIPKKAGLVYTIRIKDVK